MNVAIELKPPIPLPEVMSLFADWTDLVVFDSARHNTPLGRYSYLSADPVRTFEVPKAEFGTDPFDPIRKAMLEFPAQNKPDLPPFQGGAAGILSYELGRCFERLPTVPHDELGIPHLAVGIYDWVIAWDHQSGQSWVISTGYPEVNESCRAQRASDRAERVLQVIRTASSGDRACDKQASLARLPREKSGGPFKTTASQIALTGRTFPTDVLAGLLSNFSHESYLRAIERVIEYIRAGDIFQANLAQRLIYASDESPLSLYQRLRQCNPAPFAGFFCRDDWAVASASPERFLQLTDGLAETRPIKGTRRRQPNPEADLYTAEELLESEKDLAENRMIVDLLRNDLSRVCQPGSIRVPQLCEVETYETVQHLVSVIQGQLKPGFDAWDLLRVTFPGGSITGAPKVRAMEIISELEQVARGPYCGSLFYVGFDGRLDSSILIRTFVCRRGWVQCSVGGGVTVLSQPEEEFRETLHKAAGMLHVWQADNPEGAG